MPKFIIQGRHMQTMERVYYTGRASTYWTSPNKADAFTYDSETLADRKAREFNRVGALHKITWTAAYASDDDAHAAGAAAMSAEICG